jgi:hypothetical protein
VTRGKSWSVDEERQLRNLVAEGKGLGDISGVLGKTRVSVKAKLFNLGLGSVKDATGVQKVVVASSSKLKLPERLPSVEEKLKVLDAALVALEQPGLSHADVLRLRSIIQGVKTYQELFANFVNYRGLEAEVLELRKQLASENAKAAKEASSNVSR